MGTSKGKRYKCPYCDYRNYRAELIDHVEDDHEDMIPKDYTPARIVYNTINKKEFGSCMICHKETKWDENKQRYDTLCGNKKCKDEYVKIVRSRMVKKYGTHNLLTDPNFQKKMLENRSISGKYKFEDGGSIGYVGSYEKKFLEFMDKFLHIKSYDIISPGPNIPYVYKGKEHVWITDFIYEPYNLVFDIKDGGDNPNTRDMKEYREKQIAKEKAIAEYGDYNYIRLTDNKFEQLISIFMELKEKVDDKPLIRINESSIEESVLTEASFFYKTLEFHTCLNIQTLPVYIEQRKLIKETIKQSKNNKEAIENLKKIRTKFKSVKTWRMNHGNIIPILDKKIKEIALNSSIELIDKEISRLENIDESCIEEAKNDKGEEVPKVCPKCGSKIGVFIKGEPVFLCTNKECNKYFGTVPFKENSIEESSIAEGVFNNSIPNDVKRLAENIKKILDAKSENIDGVDDVVDVVKDTIKGKDFSGTEKDLIYKTCNRLGLKIHGYTKSDTSIKGVTVTHNHKIIATFKEYILTLKFIGVKGDIKLPPMGIAVNYNSNNSDIPKGVAFDFISTLSPYVDKVKSTAHSIKISALSNAIDSGFPRLVHKHIMKYRVKKNVGGLSITLSSYKDINESSPVTGAMHRQDYNPNAVYIVNYLKKNTFERDLAVCRDKMSCIFVCDNGEPTFTSLTDFKEMADDIKVYKCLLDISFDRVVRVSKSGLDFYKNIVDDNNVEISTLESDYRFNKVPSYIDELNSIEECILNSVPKSGYVHEVYCPIIPLVNLNIDESVVHYFRDINGVFAQNIDTLVRSASYPKVEDIPETTIKLLNY